MTYGDSVLNRLNRMNRRVELMEMRTAPAEISAAWVGWCRPSVAARRVWAKVATGPTEAECWQKVYAVMDRNRGGARDWVVLPAEVKP